MPISTSMYPIVAPNNELPIMNNFFAPTTAKEMVDLQGRVLLNRLGYMQLEEHESAKKDEQSRKNYLLKSGLPLPPQAALATGGAGTPPPTNPLVPTQKPIVPAPTQNAMVVPPPVPLPAIDPTAGYETGGNKISAPPTRPSTPVSPFAPSQDVPAQTSPDLIPPVTEGSVTPSSEPVNPSERAALGLPEKTNPILDQVAGYFRGDDLPQPTTQGELIAKQQIMIQRQAKFETEHKKAMELAKPMWEHLIKVGDNKGKNTFIDQINKNPYLAGLADHLKDVEITGPGKTTGTGTLNKDQLTHLAGIAETPFLKGIIANAPEGHNYEVKTENGKVVEFKPIYEKSETAEQLARRAIVEEKKLKGDKSPVTAQEILDKMGLGKSKTDYQLSHDVVKEALIAKGITREPTAKEIEDHMMTKKEQIARAQMAGRLDPMRLQELAKMLVAGEIPPSMITNAFGIPEHNAAIIAAKLLDKNYNPAEQEANFQWYNKNQRLIRRTESIIAKHGAINEAIRLAKVADQPAGTPLNKILGPLGVAIGSSRRQLFEEANSILAEEGGQIFGSSQAGVRFLELAQTLTDVNLSVEQYINAAKEMKYLILTRQMANVRGTPAQAKYDEAYREAAMERPFLTEAEKKEAAEFKPEQFTTGRETKEKKSSSGLTRDAWIKAAKKANPNVSLDAINKMADEKFK